MFTVVIFQDPITVNDLIQRVTLYLFVFNSSVHYVLYIYRQPWK